MPPPFAGCDPTDLRRRKADITTDDPYGLTVGASRTDQTDNIGIDSRIAVHLARLRIPTTTSSTLCPHVSDVVRLRSEEQMRRVNAPRLVTSMQNRYAIWNRTVLHLP